MTYEGEKLLTLDRDGIHVAAASVAEKLAKKSLSPSTVTGLEGCTARWVTDSFVTGLLVEEQPDNAARRGSLFHSTMEAFFAHEPEKRTKDLMKQTVAETLKHEDYRDLASNRDAVAWLRGAINGYYNMGGDPMKVKIADIERVQHKKDGTPYTKREKGIEIFVKGNVGAASRPTLGFIDQVIEDPTRDDGAVVVQDWKGLALNTPIPTPTGWRTMEDLKVNDFVLGSDGQPVRVVKKSNTHKRPCYELEFNTGEKVVCDNVHLWKISYNNRHKSVSQDVIVSAEELAKLFSNDDNFAFKIVNPEPLNLEPKNLPIDPYLLGVWLGDGTSKSGSITVGEQDQVEMGIYLSEIWPSMRMNQEKPNKPWNFAFGKPLPGLCRSGIHENHSFNSRCKLCDLNSAESSNLSLTSILIKENLRKNKHIPEEYLLASYEQRLELLRGLMDSDGTWSRARKRAIFGGINKQLAYDFATLVASFGVTPYLSSYDNKKLPWKNNELYGKTIYSVEFSTFSMNPFKLKRKFDLAANYSPTHKTIFKSSRKYIKNIREVESVPTQCIGVDAEDSLYQFGKFFTLTHNTGAKAKKYKAGRKSEEGLPEQRQQIIYSELLRQDGVQVSGARLIFPVAREVVNVELGNTELRDRVLRDVEQADERLDRLIETNTFNFSSSFLCHWCPLAKICPSAGQGQGAFPKPYEKTMAAYKSQPEPEILAQGIEIL